MSEEQGPRDEPAIGSGRFQRKPLATLSRMAATIGRDDVRLPTDGEIDDLIAYLSMAKKLGGVTFRQMDAFWELNRKLMSAHAELREFYRERPAYDDGGEYDEPPPDETAVRWLNGLSPEDYRTVAEAAYAQFKDEFAVAPEDDFPVRGDEPGSFGR